MTEAILLTCSHAQNRNPIQSRAEPRNMKADSLQMSHEWIESHLHWRVLCLEFANDVSPPLAQLSRHPLQDSCLSCHGGAHAQPQMLALIHLAWNMRLGISMCRNQIRRVD